MAGNFHSFLTFHVVSGEDGKPFFGFGTLADFEAAYATGIRPNGMMFVDMTTSTSPIIKFWDTASTLWRE